MDIRIKCLLVEVHKTLSAEEVCHAHSNHKSSNRAQEKQVTVVFNTGAY